MSRSHPHWISGLLAGFAALAALFLLAAGPAHAGTADYALGGRLSTVFVGPSTGPGISADGRYVAFNGDGRAYIRDRSTGTTLPIANAAACEPFSQHGSTSRPVLSGNGRLVLFIDSSPNTHTGDTYAVYVLRDLQTGADTCVRQASEYLNGDITLSSDGRFVAFSSGAPGSRRDVIVWDRTTQQEERVSVASGE